MNRQQARQVVMTETFLTRPSAAAQCGRLLGRLGVLAAVLALALVGGAVGRTAAPAAAAGGEVRLCDGAAGGDPCVTVTQDTPDLRTLTVDNRTVNFDNRASYADVTRLSLAVNEGMVALYTDINYGGRCQPLWAGSKIALASTWVGDNAVSSVRIGDCRPTDNNGSKIWRFNPNASGSGRFVSDVKVIAGGSSSISCGDGWVKAEFFASYAGAAELNRGAGGAYIYLCLRFSNIPTFRTIYAVAGDSSAVACNDARHYKVPVDLNKGAGGKFIYFCVDTDTGVDNRTGTWPADGVVGNQLYFVHVPGVVQRHSEAYRMAQADCTGLYPFPTLQELTRVLDTVDLNKGAGGDWIFTCHNRVPRS